MLPVTPLPAAGEVLLDTRGSGRVLRVSWHSADATAGRPPDGHAASDLVVLSLWHGATCTGSFRLAATDVPALVDVLQTGLTGLTPAASAQPPDAGLVG